MSAEALRLFKSAPRLEDSPYVCPAVFNPKLPMSRHTYWHGWRRILERAGLPHIGTHGIRHRAATDNANSGIPVKVGMALTAHKTVTMFMRYVHTEDDPVRDAVEAVTLRRQSLVGVSVPPPSAPAAPDMERTLVATTSVDDRSVEAGNKPLGFEDGRYTSRTKLGNYRPFRYRKDDNRMVPPDSKRAG